MPVPKKTAPEVPAVVGEVIPQDILDIVEAAIALTRFKQTGYGRQDPWWKREALWCHFCVRNIEMGQEHRDDCPAKALDDAVEAYMEAEEA